MKTKSFRLVLAAGLCVFCNSLHGGARPGSLDTSFDPTAHGRLIGPAQGESVARCLAQQADGKLLIGGEFVGVDGAARNRLARLNADGTLDANFNIGAGADGAVNSLAVQPDGKILVAGDFGHFDGVACDSVVRLNRNGRVDNSFRPQIGHYLSCVAVQPDGRILVGGSFTNVEGATRVGIARLNPDGSLDPGFNAAGAVTNSDYGITSILIQPDGRILVAGFPRALNQPLLRLNANGSADPTFQVPTIQQMPFVGWVVAVALDEQGQILVSGRFTEVNGRPRPGIARLLGDGSLDGSFVPPAISAEWEVYIAGMALQTDGGLIIGGNFISADTQPCRGLARLLSDGRLDSGFAAPDLFPGAVAPWIRGLAANGDNDVFVAAGVIDGWGANSASFPVSKLLANGRMDPAFRKPTLAGAVQIWRVAARPDGKVLIGLSASATYNGVTRSPVALLNRDGTLDADFAPPMTGPAAWAITVQPDGRVVVGGSPFTIGTSTKVGLVRLLSDGRLDPGFQVEDCENSYPFISGVTLQPDGKLLVTGDFVTLRGIDRPYIARLNADGTLDPSFSLDPSLVPDLDNDAPVGPVAVQADGKILIGGLFVGGGDQLLRLLPDGLRDPSFPVRPIQVNKIIVQPDQRILVLGRNWADGDPALITRLNADGSLERVFDTASWYQADDMVLQADDKVIASLTGLHSDIVRFNVDGSLDRTFSVSMQSGLSDSWVHALALEPDGRVLVAGQFSSIDGITTHAIARLHNDLRLSCRLRATLHPGSGSLQLALSSEPGAQAVIETSVDLIHWQTWSTVTNSSGLLELSDPQTRHLNRRFYRAFLR